MKSLRNTFIVGALALAALGTTASAKDAETVLTLPSSIRCQECGAEYRLKPEVMKDNSVRIKAQLINKAANPKTH